MSEAFRKTSIFLLIKPYIQNTLNSKFIRNVAIIAIGTATAQGIKMAFSPLVTRIYGPEAFGLLGTFMAIVSILTPVAALSYPIAIVLPREDSDAKGIAQLSMAASFFIVGLISLIIIFVGERLVILLHLQSINNYIWFIPLIVFFEAFNQIIRQWLIRKKEFSISARIAVVQAFILESAKAGFGYFYPLASILVILATTGHALNAGLLALGIKCSQKSQEGVEKSVKPKSSLKALARHHYDFPLYRTPQVFINAVSQSFPILMLSAFFGPSAAGFYTLSRTVLGIPSKLIGKAVGDVFYPRITEAAHKKEILTHLILKATFALAAVGFLPFAIIIFFGPCLFSFVFGEEWIVAGNYARWIALWLYFMFINTPSVKVLPVLSAQGFHLLFTLFTIIIRLSVILFSYYFFNSDIIAISLFGISGAILNIFLVMIIINKCRTFDNINKDKLNG